MSILKFDKEELGNLQYSLQREFISTNRAGGYMSTTITCCNTRKYHGLMICPSDTFKNDYFVLLSSIDETVIQREHGFNLALHNYPGLFEPKGHKYIESFEYTPTPTIIYRVGGVQLKKELLWLHSKEQLLIRYTLLKASSPTKLRLRPFLAFRNMHALSKENIDANVYSTPIEGGVSNKMYEGLPTLHLQLDTKNEFVPAPDWYKDFVYQKELERGYEYKEDLLTTGFFEFDIDCGQSVILSCSTSPAKPSSLKRSFTTEIAKRSNKTEFHACLRHSARQFIIKRDSKTEVVAGYPWLGYHIGRSKIVALPGITLEQGNTQQCVDVLKSITKVIKGGIFSPQGCNLDSLDAPLWIFWVLQIMEKYEGREFVFSHFGKEMLAIIEAYSSQIGEIGGAICESSLVKSECYNKALTWMDRYVDGIPVTPRDGYQVEVNALWYNALCYALEFAKESDNKKFLAKWENTPQKVKENFCAKFINPEGYLADYVDGDRQNKDIRPNQIIACSLPYKMIDENTIVNVINIVKSKLLTPKGLRTLSPDSALYEPYCEGDANTRARAVHQGSVHSWLLYFYIRANVDVFGKQYLFSASELIEGLEDDFLGYGIGTMAQRYDGDPPHRPGGAVSHAASVGTLLLIMDYIEKFKEKNK